MRRCLVHLAFLQGGFGRVVCFFFLFWQSRHISDVTYDHDEQHNTDHFHLCDENELINLRPLEIYHHQGLGGNRFTDEFEESQILAADFSKHQ